MTRTPALLISAFCATSMAFPLMADAPAPGPVQTVATDHVNFAPGGAIHLNDLVGDVIVEGWDRPEVEIVSTMSLGYDAAPPSKAKDRLNAVHVATDRKSDTELTLSSSRPKLPGRFTHPVARIKDREVNAEYHIHVPRNSHLIVERAKGYVSVTGVTGDIEANDSRGDIILMLPDLASFSIDAVTKAGAVTADVSGATHGKNLVGETFRSENTNHPHKLILRMGFGGITIKELPPESITPAMASLK